MITCAQCQAANPVGTDYCESCGGQLATTPAGRPCPFCGTPAIAADRYCCTCGRPLDEPAQPAARPTRSVVTATLAAPAAPVAGNAVQARLLVQGPGGEQRVVFQGHDLLLGRSDRRARIFPDVDLDDTAASRRHLMLWAESGRLWGQDLESGNGTMLNSVLMPPGEPCELHDGDVIKIGRRYVIRLRIER
jgi:pSer/pThr/pTyr-binding forkhead associated (FHA) protein